MDYLGMSTKVEMLFSDLETDVTRLKDLTDIRCPENCGMCCESSKLETTVLECIPLSIHLWKIKKARHFLNFLRRNPGHKMCLFYRKDKKKSGKGRCDLYAYRPLLCRLFGFSAALNKYNKVLFAGCKVIRETYPEVVKKANTLIMYNRPVPIMRHYRMRLFAIDPFLGANEYPINYAITKALELFEWPNKRKKIA